MQQKPSFSHPMWRIIFAFLLAAAFLLLEASGMIALPPALAGGLGFFCFIAAMALLFWWIGEWIREQRRDISRSGRVQLKDT